MSLVLATQAPHEPEIFASIQGEGPSMGVPCTFVRLSRCNLACVWCDTAYTWHFTGDERPHRSGETYERKPNQLTLSEAAVAERVSALAPRRLVLTGGEPTLQAPALAKMLQQLDRFTVEIETNGTSPPHPALDPLIDQYNVSPKLAHSGNPAELALVPERLSHWAQEPRAFFKFVIATPEDVAEVDALVAEYGIDPSRVFLMAEGTVSETLRTREKWLTPLCIERGYRLSDRLHIHLFGDTRGT